MGFECKKGRLISDDVWCSLGNAKYDLGEQQHKLKTKVVAGSLHGFYQRWIRIMCLVVGLLYIYVKRVKSADDP